MQCPSPSTAFGAADLEHAAGGSEFHVRSGDGAQDSQLPLVRLGVASALFTAMRYRFPAMADHGLRVGITASAWSIALGLPPQERDAVEVAGLLHDVGCLIVPDHVLLKPGPLTADETRLVECSRKLGAKVLQSACADASLLAIIEHVGARFDGSKPGYRLSGAQIPRGARMLAIVEAFDAMTTDQVYRPAMGQERAIGELFRCGGRQFDPELVRLFAETLGPAMSGLREAVRDRWLHHLDRGDVNSSWRWTPRTDEAAGPKAESPFHVRLLENMRDAAIFIDADLRVIQWNHQAERLTGIAAASIQHRRWSLQLLGFCSEQGEPIGDEECPVVTAIRSGMPGTQRIMIALRNRRPLPVDVHVIPVAGEDGAGLGAVLLLCDALSETTLEKLCLSLQDKATKDPLTQVANRAEFDKAHSLFVLRHEREQVPCSLIMCDLDKFKRVNDTYGHQAGDDAIVALATLLTKHCRAGDLVARYGGEEFVMLLDGCGIATAARRAEEVRTALERLPLPRMDGQSVTASFGVTEIQAGDTAETMLNRADRALLLAKSRGRNRVVQLGGGVEQQEEEPPQAPQAATSTSLPLCQAMSTPVPLSIAVEKLRGFVADHRAEILSADAEALSLRLESRPVGDGRPNDRPMSFTVDLRLGAESDDRGSAAAGGQYAHTRICATVRAWHKRDARRSDAVQRACLVLASVRAYLMATAETPPQSQPSEAAPSRSLLARLFSRRS